VSKGGLRDPLYLLIIVKQSINGYQLAY